MKSPGSKENVVDVRQDLFINTLASLWRAVPEISAPVLTYGALHRRWR
jgi:hypothetical protein